MTSESWKTFEEIEPGLYWCKQLHTCYDPSIVRYYLSAHDSTPYMHYLESNNRFKVTDLKIDVLRFVLVKTPNVGKPGSGSGVNGAVELCDEQYELEQQ